MKSVTYFEVISILVLLNHDSGNFGLVTAKPVSERHNMTFATEVSTSSTAAGATSSSTAQLLALAQNQQLRNSSSPIYVAETTSASAADSLSDYIDESTVQENHERPKLDNWFNALKTSVTDVASYALDEGNQVIDPIKTFFIPTPPSPSPPTPPLSTSIPAHAPSSPHVHVSNTAKPTQGKTPPAPKSVKIANITLKITKS